MTEYNIGDLVWAKMHGFPPWPGRISEPPEILQGTVKQKKKTVYHCIYFFGSHDYSWIEAEKLKPYHNHKDEFKDLWKSVKFVKACKEIEEFSESALRIRDSVSIDLSTQDELNTCNFRIGFVGLGNMGKALVKCLLRTGHTLVLWNRSSEKMNEFRNSGVKVASTAGEVVDQADITFICVSDAVASKDIMFGNHGAMSYLGPGKSYVDITSTDLETSLALSEAVVRTGARYLEVRLQGSIREANEGTLICLAAGEQSLYNDCSSIFKACTKTSIFLGEVGNATKIHLIMQLIIGVNLAGLAESLAMADRSGLDKKELLTVLKISQLSSPLVLEKAKAMLDGDWVTNSSLRDLQTNLKYAILMGETHDLHTPMGTSVNQIFKQAKNLGYGEHDVSAIFSITRF